MDGQEASPANQQQVNGDDQKQNLTDSRRKYPKDTKDRKSEWLAMEQHKKDVNEEISRNENEIRTIKQKELMTELDRKVLNNLEERQDQLIQKRQDAEQALQQKQQFDETITKLKQDRKMIQQNLGNIYTQQQMTQLEKDMENKKHKLEWESQLIEYNRQKLESEQRRKRQHRDFLQQERSLDLKRAQEKKVNLFVGQQQDKQEYQQLVQQNAQRELIKEENYRNFYKLAAENQTTLHQLHIQNVMKPLLERQKHLEEIIIKNVDQTAKQRAQLELNQIMQRKNQLQQMKNQNLNLIQNHQNQVLAGKVEKVTKVQERLVDLQNYQQYLDYKKKEKIDHQNQYKMFLEQQIKTRDDLMSNQIRMTRQEKGLNKQDLEAYKAVNPGLYSMLPGWNPQIGQLPPKQNREKIQEIVQFKTRQQPVLMNNQIPAGSQPANGQVVILNPNVLQNKSTVQVVNRYQKIGEPLDKFYRSYTISNKQSPRQLQQACSYKNIFTYGHNPITNPIPYNIQNPYIAKEFVRAQSKNNIFSQTGQQISNQNQK